MYGIWKGDATENQLIKTAMQGDSQLSESGVTIRVYYSVAGYFAKRGTRNNKDEKRVSFGMEKEEV